MSTEIYSSPEVTMLTGMTYRQLDHCISTGLVTPSVDAGSGSGSRRRFNAADVALLRVVTALRSMGVRGRAMQSAIALVANAVDRDGFLVLPTTGEPFIDGDPSVVKKEDACCVVNLTRLMGIDQ